MTASTGVDPARPGAGVLPADEPVAALSHRQILLVVGGVVSGMFLAALDQSIVGTALPRIVSDLGGLEHLSWVVTAYLLTSTAVTPLWGKVSDLYGRRLTFQVAISVFLLGSVLAGLSQSMTQLIGFRALQGLGGGGLFAIALAIIGDVIPPRDRGRYQGYFGAVFGASSVLGPLVGGGLTDGPGWRWIFYINVPIGAAALVITSVALKMPVVRREHRIDYLGAAAIVGSVTTLLLYLNWAGRSYGWGDPQALWLLAAAVALAVAFVAIELRAVEPILPMRLFHDNIFAVSNIFSFLVGAAMFGALIFLPVYLQAVKGMSATESGLAMIPAVAGVVGMSVVSGRRISTTGRYKRYPLVGTLLLIAGQLLLSRIQVGTPYWQVAVAAFLTGSGLGLTMQSVTVAVQNAVSVRDMGAATSAVIFFRQTGSAVGTAVFGAVLASRLATHLAEQLQAAGPAVAAGVRPGLVDDVTALQQLTEPVRTPVLTAFAAAVADVQLAVVPFVVLSLVAVLFLREIPLRTTLGPPPPAE